MNKKALILAFAITGAICINSAFANSSQPGGQDDPVVTKSYVEKRISESLGNNGLSGLSRQELDFIIDEVANSVLHNSGSEPARDIYTPVSASKGQVIIGGEGTEIILRSGKAQGYTESPDGLVNATTGEEMGNSSEIGKNNLLIVPRADGRGVFCLTDCWFIIKGEYSLK